MFLIGTLTAGHLTANLPKLGCHPVQEVLMASVVIPLEDPRDRFRADSSQLGGNPVPVVFTDRQIAALGAIADELIPAGDGFPAPSSVGVVEEFFTRYVTPADIVVNRFPYARETEFKAAVDALADDFLAANSAGRVNQLANLERDEPDFFGQLRALTYGGYYSRPAVLVALRSLPAGRDYHGAPLPRGYDQTTADWDDLIPPGVGSYIRTTDVVRTTVKARP
ncbi:gluconate 2-dehydrogenase subunit 3 family protein [Kribbella turkmenica]|uniref:Gluconate 2-dehydrogenase subunit 3 family protein n=1 Tax=Kribbella turkmenica TaxID=2530375 RepID=A0A4R4XGR7_9ACTN|nr:gluconate 2-dehydrogenase subunit 3 family protein [Kribbella turkmenica]TDD30006.1 gluconate 2-dehydrogenase subunit 3 family protein [Kribbella turkmenica]